MEDAYFILDNPFKDNELGLYAVLDGHGGGEVVESCTQFIPDIFKKEYKKNIDAKELFKTVMKKTDDQLRLVGASDQGACVCLALVRKEANNVTKCYVANLGDTRAVLCENDKAIRVSTDHKAVNEQEIKRIKEMGGIIIRGRVSGSLAITRALGDLDLKTEGVLNVPDTEEFVVSQKTQYLILASDGLWDVCDDQKAVDLCKNINDTAEMAKKLLKYALDNGSRDNTSVMVLRFN
ncbi:protein phosphatase, putative [Ichthyophthirius multifiliis]|uniref:Protein phosphatase, putative n=1 Tax=Ichthyophthirius multifiliis TaxID=5932 RepID=G0QN85_ICHMU|nr:protein phosphatase, putative [Ichthyophthirius multifiliis]EGR33322.1 protein phosphatase, putative [Ichthyophthirius multifiliis]|eukprot:XP_004037308.1 protein phosphatase, putative [Ichthyophthirius multifiliis]